MPTTKPTDLSKPEHDKIITFLRQHPVGVLASVSPDGDPNASAVYFSVDDDLRLTFTTKEDTQKHHNIAHHNHVMLVVYDAVTQSTVQVGGGAEEVTDAQAAQKIYHGTLQAAKQTGPDAVPPVAKIAAGAYVAYEIKPTNIWMTEYGWGDNFAHALQHANDPASTGDPA